MNKDKKNDLKLKYHTNVFDEYRNGKSIKHYKSDQYIYYI